MTLMQTPSKAGDLDGQGRRSRDAEAVWVMPLQAKGCHRPPAPPEPRGPGDRRPLVASRAPPPTLQTDSLVLDFRPPEKGECILCPSWKLVQQRGVHRTLCSAGCVHAHTLCCAGMNHVNLQGLLPGLKPGTGGRGWVPGAARLGQGGFMKD